MRDFNCPNCGQRLAFENSKCLSCGARLGFSLDDMALLVIAPEEESEHAGGAVDEQQVPSVRESASGGVQLVGGEGAGRQAVRSPAH